MLVDYLLSQKIFKMALLPTAADAVLAAAAAAARAALPPRHYWHCGSAWQWLGRGSWRMYISHAPARRSHARTTCLRILRARRSLLL
jgi:hypothetical protein